MASRNDTTASWRLFEWFRRFRQDQRGTAMTELIVTLPVFVIIFAGIAHLYTVERESVRVKIFASKDMWNNAMDAAKTGLIPPPEQGIPVMAGVDGLGTINDYPSEQGDMFGQMNHLGLISDGSVGEGDYANTVLDFTGSGPSGSVPGENLSDYPQDMLDDSRFNFITSAPGPLMVYMPIIPLSMLGPNQTVAANTRYGMVAGYHKLEFDVGGRDYTFESAYDVGNSPVAKPVEEDILIVPGFSRLMAEDDPCLSNILELSTDMGYMSNCF